MKSALDVRLARMVLVASMAVLLTSCGGGAGGGTSAPSIVPSTPSLGELLVSDVQTIIAQAVAEAQAEHAAGTIAVVDRVGNVLAVFRMNGALTTFTITSGRGVTGGLENVNTLPDGYAAIAKALTGAYLSSNGNAFTTRTASQIIQENFNPGQTNQPSGPLFGVQYSQFSCSDVMQRSGNAGPQHSPLGLAASPGGFPLYKSGILVGGIGVIADGTYSLDTNISSSAADVNELIAVAGSTGYAAPSSIRANMITANGLSLRYDNSEAILSNPANAPSYSSLAGSLLTIAGFTDGTIHAGTVFGTPASGVRPDTGAFASLGGYVLADGTNAARYVPIAGSDGLLAQNEVQTLLQQGLMIANHARAQIRQPIGSTAQLSIVVVDTQGNILGLVRTSDAPVFGIDVAVQKARTAVFFSQTQAAAQLQLLPAAQYLNPAASSSIADYVPRVRSFLNLPLAFSDGTAYSARAIGNITRPFFPDGINGSANGAFSKPYSQWSIFSDGLQLDLSYNAVVAAALGSTATGCTGNSILKNGIQIFPGAVPIYRAGVLIGSMGVSGDGVDQDDMVSFLGVANAAAVLNDGLGNAPAAIRADQIAPEGGSTHLVYAQCPQTPFVDSTAQNVCSGL